MKRKHPVLLYIIVAAAAILFLCNTSIRKSLTGGGNKEESDYMLSELFSNKAMAASVNKSLSPSEEFVKGMDSFTTFSREENGENGVSLRFSSWENSFTAVCLWFNGSVHVAIEDAQGNRSLVFSDGKLAMDSKAGFSYPRIGFSSEEKPTNRYMVGIHDFTDDGNPEFLLAVKDGEEGTAFFVLEYSSGSWTPIGEIVSQGKGLGGGRIFRQAFTLKDSSGTMSSWTCHGHSFDYLCSDHVTKMTDLF